MGNLAVRGEEKAGWRYANVTHSHLDARFCGVVGVSGNLEVVVYSESGQLLGQCLQKCS